MQPEETVFGEPKGFHVTVQKVYCEEAFEIVLWPSNHGAVIRPKISTQEKAKTIAQFLYDQLLPEYEAEKVRQNAWLKKFNEEQAKKPKPKPVTVKKNAPKIDVLECPECRSLVRKEDVGEPVYECSQCGQKGVGDDGRRCDDCHRFNAKLGQTSCPECEDSMDEAETVQAQEATDGSLVKVGEQP